MIHFNRPYMTGKETEYIRKAVESGKISGNGMFTAKCQSFFESRYGFGKCLLTTSCTDALEMAAILSGVGPGDEVIVPSYTFVSSALAFVRQGATVVFADSRQDQPNIDEAAIESLVTPRTKAIVPVHYAGVACDMDAVMAVAERHGLVVVEDAAQAVDSFYKGRPLGSIGHLAAFSFHETKNIISGEGGMLVVNDGRFARRAEIIWEKGTNRAEFFRGEVNKYGWVDTGSSFLPTEIVSAFLYAQLEHLDEIQAERKRLWGRYMDFFSGLGADVKLPVIPDFATNNAHMFYLLFPDLERRTLFIAKMRERGILTVFHYLPLHSSEFFRGFCARRGIALPDDGRFPNCNRYADTLVRLPLYCGLADDQDAVLSAAKEALS